MGPWTAAVTGERNEKIEKRFTGATQAVEIDHVAVDSEGTWVYVNGDHGLSLRGAGVEEFYWPRRIFAGAAGFTIPTAVTTHPLPAFSRPQPLTVKSAASAPQALKPGVHVTYLQGSGHECGKLKTVSESVIPNANAKTIGTLEPPGAVRLESSLRVPTDGVYTFHFGASDEYRMTLENVAVIETFRGCSVMPEARQVRLSAGLYGVTLECFRETNRMPVWFTADWEGPGLPRQSFLPALKGK